MEWMAKLEEEGSHVVWLTDRESFRIWELLVWSLVMDVRFTTLHQTQPGALYCARKYLLWPQLIQDCYWWTNCTIYFIASSGTCCVAAGRPYPEQPRRLARTATKLWLLVLLDCFTVATRCQKIVGREATITNIAPPMNNWRITVGG